MYKRTPYGGSQLERYVESELEALEVALLPLFDGAMEVRNVAPAKPRNGLYYADGTNWNPGSGRGIYRYDESTQLFYFLG